MIITNHKQLLSQQYVRGYGYANKEIIGKGIMTDTMKMLGRKFWLMGKQMFKQHLLPKLAIAAKHGLQSGKQLIEDNKNEIGKIISDQSKNLMKNLLEKSKRKEVITDTKNQLSNIVDKNKEVLSQRGQEMLNSLISGSPYISGSGLKVIRNSTRKKK